MNRRLLRRVLLEILALFAATAAVAGTSTPLHQAAADGDSVQVARLLDGGADPEARDDIQRTPLFLAVENDHAAVVRQLIARGADIDAVAARGFTPILWGARNGRAQAVDALIAAGAVIAPDDRLAALQFASGAGMPRLFDHVRGLGYDLQNARRQDPGLLFPAAAGGSAAIVDTLLRHGFDPRQTDAFGYTSLHAAAAHGHVGVIECLLAAGVEPDARSRRGETAYNFALLKGFPEAAAMLVAHGADARPPAFPPLAGPYMGQDPPGDVPELFLPGIVSGPDRAHSSITFAPDGSEACWTEMIPPEGRVARMSVVDGRWTYPESAALDRDPTYAPDGRRLFHIRTRPLRDGERPGGDPQLKEEYWYQERTADGWSSPVPAGAEVNAIGVHWPCSVDADGNLYFSAFADSMYCAPLVEGKFAKPVDLTEHLRNPTLVGCSPFMSPDGDYLLFVAGNRLNISFRRDDGAWTDATPLDDTINGSHTNGSPRVTVDGKYLFFVSAGRGRPWGIYWMSAAFIGRMREASGSPGR